MEKTFRIGLIIFWSIVALLLIAGLVVYSSSKPKGNLSQLAEDTGKLNEYFAGLDGDGNPVDNLYGNTNSANQFQTEFGVTYTTELRTVEKQQYMSAELVAPHNSRSDCWQIIDGKVYDVTNYIPFHPGGADTILDTCGTDATAGYNDRDGKGTPHSKAADVQLNSLFVAAIGDPWGTITVTEEVQVPVNNSQTGGVNADSGLSNNNGGVSNNKFSIGEKVQTIDSVRGRRSPSISAELVTTLPVGAEGRVMAGPEEADGYQWYDIYYHNGTRAWSVEDYLGRAGVTPSSVTATTPDPVTTSAPAAPPVPVTTPQPVVEQNTVAMPVTTTNSVGLTANQVALHDRVSDCWLIVNNNIYDVTAYTPFHPGGQSTITPYCGQEATEAFATKGDEGEDHSSSAYAMLDNYYLGPLSGAANAADTTSDTTNEPVACRSFSYTPWDDCNPDGTRTRNITGASPAGCVGGTPNTQLSCSYSAPRTDNSDSLTTNEISKHDSRNDCWLIIDDKVYNVTDYIPFHPGGESTITPYCGEESTRAFETKGGEGNDHSNSAYDQLDNYYIGDVGSQAVNDTNPTNETCRFFTYSSWSACQSNGTQSRTVLVSIPDACVGGTPVTQRSCNYVPPPATCTSFTYGSWGACQSNGTQTRGVTGSAPAGCVGGTPETVRSCNYVPPVVTPDTCTSFTYGSWGACQSDGTQTRSVTGASPSSCTGGSPSNTRSCTYTPPNNTPPSSSGYTMSQVATHNRSSDCWMVIDNQVYNLTQYIPHHPGGQSRIINNCGTEATTLFTGGNGNHRHSNNAWNDLPPYYVGDLSSGNTTPTTNTCTAFSYGSWGACQSNYLQTRTVTGSSPSGCTDGAPVTSRSCSYTVSGTSSNTSGGSSNSDPEDFILSVDQTGDFSITSLSLSVGDSVTIILDGNDEVYVDFSPTTISSMKLDNENYYSTHFFTGTGSWTATAREKNGNTLYISVQ